MLFSGQLCWEHNIREEYSSLVNFAGRTIPEKTAALWSTLLGAQHQRTRLLFGQLCWENNAGKHCCSLVNFAGNLLDINTPLLVNLHSLGTNIEHKRSTRLVEQHFNKTNGAHLRRGGGVATPFSQKKICFQSLCRNQYTEEEKSTLYF